MRRFAAGTKAGFAANLISQNNPSSREVRIEAVKKGEEAVVFGPNALLVNYGPSWKLEAVTIARGGVVVDGGRGDPKSKLKLKPTVGDELASSDFPISIFYIGKVFVAFIFIFLIGAIFTYFLENLPELLSYINSSSLDRPDFSN